MRTECVQFGRRTANLAPPLTPTTEEASTRSLPGIEGCTSATGGAPGARGEASGGATAARDAEEADAAAGEAAADGTTPTAGERSGAANLGLGGAAAMGGGGCSDGCSTAGSDCDEPGGGWSFSRDRSVHDCFLARLACGGAMPGAARPFLPGLDLAIGNMAASFGGNDAPGSDAMRERAMSARTPGGGGPLLLPSAPPPLAAGANWLCLVASGRAKGSPASGTSP